MVTIEEPDSNYEFDEAPRAELPFWLIPKTVRTILPIILFVIGTLINFLLPKSLKAYDH